MFHILNFQEVRGKWWEVRDYFWHSILPIFFLVYPAILLPLTSLHSPLRLSKSYLRMSSYWYFDICYVSTNFYRLISRKDTKIIVNDRCSTPKKVNGGMFHFSTNPQEEIPENRLGVSLKTQRHKV